MELNFNCLGTETAHVIHELGLYSVWLLVRAPGKGQLAKPLLVAYTPGQLGNLDACPTPELHLYTAIDLFSQM